MPHRWYNVIPDLSRPLPPPRDPEELGAESRIELLPRLFPDALIDQEQTSERWVEIPTEVFDAYRTLGRPTPLVRLKRLERVLGTRARIYAKREDVNPTGSHKPNTAVAQAYYARQEGVKKLVTETGAGQWGSAVALASAVMGLRCTVFMTRSSYLTKPYRRTLMLSFGAEVVSSPSERTEIGRRFLASDPNHPGSLGIAISEGVETVLSEESTKYAVGSVMNFTILHQTVIGLEAMRQMEEEGVEPDVIIGCVGGGSNFGGIALPFIGSRLRGEGYERTRIIGVESKGAPRMTTGRYDYEFVDSAGYLPRLKMYNLGKDFLPPTIHAAGLRYHGLSPIVSLLLREHLIEARSYQQEEAFAAALKLTRVEGLLPAPETAHAVSAVLEEAERYRRTNEEGVILLCFSGHGLLDLQSYERFLPSE
ncbi:MAG: TrpB-like pyridoxal phosphate-dependent enzyme [Aigarchaeota archaeon]|nr:TrpB-like pyridoxal phosphate-dependent enzyme [Aigarchaeota archaeon]MDW8092521.1 TrpB-like pyridoxal phosphate-dependent enzyme [Nitrososphaerota archaeon]